MSDFLWDWRYLITVILFVALYSCFEWTNIKQLAYNAMLRAKDLAKDGLLTCGKEQEDWAVKTLVKVLPKRLTIFFGEETLRAIVRFLYNKGIDWLDDGKLNNSVTYVSEDAEARDKEVSTQSKDTNLIE